MGSEAYWFSEAQYVLDNALMCICSHCCWVDSWPPRILTSWWKLGYIVRREGEMQIATWMCECMRAHFSFSPFLALEHVYITVFRDAYVYTRVSRDACKHGDACHAYPSCLAVDVPFFHGVAIVLHAPKQKFKLTSERSPGQDVANRKFQGGWPRADLPYDVTSCVCTSLVH